MRMVIHSKEGNTIWHTSYDVYTGEFSWIWEKVYGSRRVCDCPDPDGAWLHTTEQFSAYLRSRGEG